MEPLNEANQSPHKQKSSHFTECFVTRVVMNSLQILHTVKPIVKLINPFYLNREDGVTRLLPIVDVLLPFLSIMPKLDLVR